MSDITKEQIKRVYALGSAIGIVARGSKDDELHTLVSGLTGKDSVSELNDIEFTEIERELLRRMRLVNQKELLKQRPKTPVKKDIAGMMTSAQQSKAWRLIYRLCELDDSKATAGERMVGAVKKVLGKDASVKAPMAWVSFDEGGELIEHLKRYVRSAERKVKAKEAV